MKRTFIENGSDNAELQAAVSAAFQSGQQQSALDIVKKGVDCNGYMEGRVWERPKRLNGDRKLVLHVELGRRVPILLSGDVSEHFSSVHLAVGTKVRLSLRGLTLEDSPQENSIYLDKTFAWRDGVVIYANNPKTGKEAFLDTYVDAPTTSVILEPATTRSIDPDDCSTGFKRRRTMPSTSTSPQCAPIVGLSTDVIFNSAPPSGPLDLHEGSAVKPRIDSTGDESNSAESRQDVLNAQSLPSPPPELKAPQGSDDRETKLERMGTRGEASSLNGSPRRHSSETAMSCRIGVKRCAPLTDTSTGPLSDCSHVLPAAVDNTKLPLNKASSSGSRATKGSKRMTYTRRRDKTLRKQAKAASSAQEPKPGIPGQSADVDSDQDYWDAVDDDISEHLLLHANGRAVAGHSEAALSPVKSAPKEAQRPQHSEPGFESHPQVADEMDVDPVHEPKTLQQSPSEMEDDSTKSLRVGCSSSFGAYTTLILFGQPHPHNFTINIMGVANSPGTVVRTRTGEHMMTLTLYDPSNFATNGLKVCLFDKTENGLPRLDAGDVLLLRTISVDNFRGVAAVGPSFKGWQWAVFHVKTGRLSKLLEEACVMRQFTPETSELQYSIRLSDWWRDVSTNTNSFALEERLPTGSRTHKLISEADSTSYFDCTVEVLHGTRSGENVYTLFVTDYTRNSFVAPMRASWCPPALADVVLQIELWDSSSQVGPTMQAGEFYSMRNMRLRVSGGGYLEGKMQEGHKIRRLDEDQLENYPRLIELIKRKEEWAARARTSGGVHEFPQQLIEEIEEDRHFSCTVEVVHISSKDDFMYLYVTDYSARTDLVPISPTIASGALVGRVVRISLNDAQVETGRNLSAGDYITIRNLRLRSSGGGSLLSGRLGGEHRLITKLNPKTSANAELRALLKRKEEFESAQSKPEKGSTGRAARRKAKVAALDAEVSKAKTSSFNIAVNDNGKMKAKAMKCVSFNDVRASEECLAVFCVRGRVVDIFPEDLRDCTVLRCTNCNENIPKIRRRCTRCDDAMADETFVEASFQLFFRIANDEGETLDVSVSDERCSVLKDFVPDDVHEDEEAFAMFVARVKAFVGDLLEMRDGEARRRPFAQDHEPTNAPLLELMIGGWLPAGELDRVESRAYVVLKHSVCDLDS